MPPTVPIWARVSPDVRAQIERLAKADQRTTSFFVGRILAEYAKRHKGATK